jgi:hypothetical protein
MSLIETYSKVRIGKHLLDKFPIQNCLKQGSAISPLLLNFALEYVIRRVRGKQVGLEWDSSAMVYSYMLSFLYVEYTVNNVTMILCNKRHLEYVFH